MGSPGAHAGDVERRPERNGFARSPTLEILAIIGVVFVVQQFVGLLSTAAVIGLFALEHPLDHRPWALVTSIYAHGDLAHLIANTVALAVVGFPLERLTTRVRFHAFFVATGAAAGAFQVTIMAFLGTTAPVLGASGAIFALIGYVLTANRLAGGFFERVDLGGAGQLAVFAVLAAVVTLATAAPGVALAAHFFGFLLGLVAGRGNLLRPSSRRNASLK